MVLTAELAAKLVEINEKRWGKSSCKKFAGKLAAECFPCSVASLQCGFIALMVQIAWCNTSTDAHQAQTYL